MQRVFGCRPRTNHDEQVPTSAIGCWIVQLSSSGPRQCGVWGRAPCKPKVRSFATKSEAKKDRHRIASERGKASSRSPDDRTVPTRYGHPSGGSHSEIEGSSPSVAVR